MDELIGRMQATFPHLREETAITADGDELLVPFQEKWSVVVNMRNAMRIVDGSMDEENEDQLD